MTVLNTDTTFESKALLAGSALLAQCETEVYAEQYDRIGVVEIAVIQSEISRLETLREMVTLHNSYSEDIDKLGKSLEKLQASE